MKLSIIIVNYNVKYFLEQCISSTLIACDELRKKGFESEIIIVDNNSVDGSNTMINEKFPNIKLIKNKVNHGFSVANNQGINESKGEYVLLLNPDTVVEEDTFIKVIEYLDKHSKVGGLGVKMIDGGGKFLPESKRGLPSPWTAFYKISGLSKIFGKSKKFGRYHLGFLDQNEIHEVDVLSGAFMLMRKSVLNEIGLLDETFFMYGEDIDLSYRIIKAGYKNVYFPNTKIIHYKGESTKRGSLNYVFLFYKAMIIFAKKHFSKKNASYYSFFINMAIYARAFLSILHRFIKSAFLPLLDTVLIFSGLLAAKWFWESNDALGHGAPYPKELVVFVLPLFTVMWMLGLFLVKSYKRPFQFSRIIKGVLLGTVIVSSAYAFFEESIRFSRAIILLGAITSSVATLLSRILVNVVENKAFRLNFDKKTRIGIIGNKEESERVHNLLKQTNLTFDLAGYVFPHNTKEKKEGFIGSLDQLNEIIKFYKINELIFCSKDISAASIIENMTLLESKDVTYKIAPAESLFIIGSHNKKQSGDFYTIDVNLEIKRKENKLNKRILDMSFSIVLFLLFPFFIPIQKSLKNYFSNVISVLFGKKSWVGYAPVKTQYQLPEIKKGVLSPSDLFLDSELNEDKLKELNLMYARTYNLSNDFEIIWKNLRNLGRA